MRVEALLLLTAFLAVDLDASFHWLINLYIAGLDQPTVIAAQKRIAIGDEDSTSA